MADDLVDEPPEGLDVSVWIQRLTEHLNLVYQPSKKGTTPSQQADLLKTYISTSFPASARSALTYLPASLLPSKPLYLLLEGFKTDSQFVDPCCSSSSPNSSSGKDGDDDDRCWPIADESALRAYASQVAGTVGELCLALISHHSRTPITPPSRRAIIAAAAGRMGIALQYVNIARDIAVDTTMGRVYLPTTWLAEEQLTPESVIAMFGPPTPQQQQRDTKQSEWEGEIKTRSEKLIKIRKDKLLKRAFAIYEEARPVMDLLPEDARRPMIVAVESYMEIGRVLLEQSERQGTPFAKVGGSMARGRPTRATVPKMRRLKVALRALLLA